MRPQQQVGGGRLAVGGADEDIGVGQRDRRRPTLVRRREADPVAKARAQLDLTSFAPRGLSTVARHAGFVVEPAQRPQEEPQGAALLLGEEGDVDRLVGR